jgi:hypothetical protein
MGRAAQPAEPLVLDGQGRSGPRRCRSAPTCRLR